MRCFLKSEKRATVKRKHLKNDSSKKGTNCKKIHILKGKIWTTILLKKTSTEKDNSETKLYLEMTLLKTEDVKKDNSEKETSEKDDCEQDNSEK